MTTSAKLRWGFGVVIGLLVLSGALIVLRVLSIEGLLRQQSDIARPRAEAAHNLEFSILDYSLNVHEFLLDNPVIRRHASDDAAEIARGRSRYQHRNATQIIRLAPNNGPEVEAATQIMERQLAQLVLVDDLLDVSRISRGRIGLKLLRVDLASVVTHSSRRPRRCFSAWSRRSGSTFRRDRSRSMAMRSD